MFYFNVTSTIYVCDLNIEKSKIHKMKSCNFLVSSHTYDPIEIISSLSYDQHNLSLLDYVDEKIKIITITILVTIEDLHILNAVVKTKKNLKYLFVFIMKELAKEVDGLERIGDNSEKYITFKAIFNGKKETYKLKFIDTFRFTFGSLKNLLDNLTELNKCKN